MTSGFRLLLGLQAYPHHTLAFVKAEAKVLSSPNALPPLSHRCPQIPWPPLTDNAVPISKLQVLWSNCLLATSTCSPQKHLKVNPSNQTHYLKHTLQHVFHQNPGLLPHLLGQLTASPPNRYRN